MELIYIERSQHNYRKHYSFVNIINRTSIWTLLHKKIFTYYVTTSIMHLLNTFTWDPSSNTKSNQPTPDNLQTNYVDNEMWQPTGNCWTNIKIFKSSKCRKQSRNTHKRVISRVAPHSRLRTSPLQTYSILATSQSIIATNTIIAATPLTSGFHIDRFFFTPHTFIVS